MECLHHSRSTLTVRRHLSSEAAHARLFDFLFRKGVSVMPKQDGSELVIHFDRVHIIMVNKSRGEARLFENGESQEEGTLAFKSDEPAARADINNVAELVDMALRFGISYSLIARTATFGAQKAFEMLNVKAMLDKVQELTTEKERHQRFEGFEFSFTTQQPNGDKTDPTPKTAEGVTTGVPENGSKKKTTKA